MKTNFLNREKLTGGLAFILYIAVLRLIFHLIALRGYGYMGDEFYYIECSKNLAFGYVDHPPLAMLLLAVIRFIFGESLAALRVIPAICGFFFVFLTGIIARELGGKKSAMVLASLAAFTATGNMYIHNYYSMNCFDQLFWIALVLIVIKIIKTDNKQLWLIFGLVAGIGLQNKISVLFIGFGIAVGLIMTSQRKHLKDRNIWIGIAIALLMLLPFIIWNAANDWATLEFMKNASTYKNYPVSPIEFVSGQLLINNPVTVLLWLPGLLFLFFSLRMKNYRLFAWMYLVIFVIFMVQHGKNYYMAGTYPVLFAAGGIFYEEIKKQKLAKILRPVLAALILISGILLAPMGLPVLNQDVYIKYENLLDINTGKMENQELGALPQHFAIMSDWDVLVRQYLYAYEKIPQKERAECGIMVTNYHKAGVINVLGSKLGMPRAVSGHNNYHLWGPGDYTGEVMLIIGFRMETLLKYYEDVREIGKTNTRFAMPYENNVPIYFCKGVKAPMSKIWDAIKFYI